MRFRSIIFSKSTVAIAASLAAFSMLVGCGGGSDSDSNALTYNSKNSGIAPISAAERNLETVTAEPYFKVSDTYLQLEGASFDRSGNLVFVDTFGGRVLRLTPDKKLSTVVTLPKFGPAGTAIHKDGRIFVAGLGNYSDTGGSIVSVNPDGTNVQVIVPESAGFHPDDIVFDKDGGFYFTDASGTATQPTGGVYYVSPDLKTTTRVIPNMALANGVALRQDGGLLWTNEYGTGRLQRVALSGPGTVAAWGTTIPYNMVGSAPDSMRTDADGNVYVAMYGQGRYLVFNDNGVPIGQILMPNRDSGHNLVTTSLAFVPGTNDILLVSGDNNSTSQGSWVWRVKGFAKGTTLYSQQ